MAPAIISRADALAKGLKRYFNGKSCKNGHLAEKFVVNCACVECTQGRTKEWIATSPEASDLRRKNLERFKSRNPEYVKAWLAANPGKQRQYARRWYEKEPDKRVAVALKWQKDNPEKVRTRNRNRTARRKLADGIHSTDDILAILERQNWKCAECGVSIKQRRHIDHIIPLSKGGSNDKWNLQGLCPTCNCRKSDMLPDEWAKVRDRLL